MNTLIIGSTAIRHHFPDFPREPHDIDMWAREYPTHLGAQIDRRVDRFWDDRLAFIPTGDNYATPDQIYTMKVSHAPWEIHDTWRKHMHDIVWLKQRGARLNYLLHDTLYPIWEDLHGKKRVNLNQESGAFFTDAVVRIYDHDSIHDTVAHYDRPLWMDVLKDGQDVAMDMNKVWNLPWVKQVQLFREEIYATALERWMIPNDYRFSAKVAYLWALRKTITSLTKGRSATFIIDNYETFRQLPLAGNGMAWYMKRHLSCGNLLKRLEA